MDYQAFHQPIKKMLLDKITELPDQVDSKADLLKDWRENLEGKPVAEQVDIIEANAVMNFLTALEHERWNHFYFMRHFVFNDEKNLENYQHDCLITNWSDFMSSKQRDKAIYDFLSVLDLEKEEE